MENTTNQPNEKGHDANIVLAVSGPSEEEIDLAALQYATKMSSAPDKDTPDWIMTDFKAGIAWLLRYQAACASGAVDKTVSDGLCDFIEGQKCDCKIGEHCKGIQ